MQTIPSGRSGPSRAIWVCGCLAVAAAAVLTLLGVAAGGGLAAFFAGASARARTVVAPTVSAGHTATATAATTASPTMAAATATAPAAATATARASATELPSVTPSLTPSVTPAASATPPALTPSLTPLPGASQVSPADGMPLRYVPAGEFIMGAAITDTHAIFSEQPQHSVYLEAFWIDQTVVDDQQYARCVSAGACSTPGPRPKAFAHGDYYADPKYANYPVTEVSWSQANDYCAWAGRRLPTDAEWEKAARGTDGRLYPWGNDAPTPKLADYSPTLDAKADTTPVGLYPQGASPYGALDMSGNVWQWVADWFDPTYYTKAPARNPTGPATGIDRTIRGSAFLDEASNLRVTPRNQGDPGLQSAGLGFRCAAS